MISITTKGDFKNTFAFLNRIIRGDIYRNLDRYGQMGVDALSRATPVDTNLSAHSWHYEIIMGKHKGIKWYNTDVTSNGTPVVILLQYGHGTGTGGYVRGRDFINPAMKPIFDQIADNVWKEVTR